MARNPGATKRIAKTITLPSPTLQAFLKDLVLNDEEYLTFLENFQGSLSAHGLELAEDVSEKLFIDFRFAVDRARRAVKNGGGKLRFEDVFGLPFVALHGDHLRIEKQKVATETGPDAQYSDTDTESNRGVSTGFSPDTESQTSSSTDHWSTRSFDSTSLFKLEYRKERFTRSPLLSAETVEEVVKAIKANVPER